MATRPDSKPDNAYWTAKIVSGELLCEEAFRSRLKIESRTRFKTVLVGRGDFFSIEIDGTEYFPAFFALGPSEQARLCRICRAILHTPTHERYLYLTTSQASLGGHRPLDCLTDNERYNVLLKVAQQWADAWHLTSLRVYNGTHSFEPGQEQAVFVATTDGDPRAALWRKCIAAIETAPPEERTSLNTQTVFIWQEPRGFATPEMHARLTIDVHGTNAVIRVEEITHRSLTVPLPDVRNTNESLRTIFAAFVEASELAQW